MNQHLGHLSESSRSDRSHTILSPHKPWTWDSANISRSIKCRKREKGITVNKRKRVYRPAKRPGNPADDLPGPVDANEKYNNGERVREKSISGLPYRWSVMNGYEGGLNIERAEAEIDGSYSYLASYYGHWANVQEVCQVCCWNAIADKQNEERSEKDGRYARWRRCIDEMERLRSSFRIIT